MKLIDKDAVVAEIERRICHWKQRKEYCPKGDEQGIGTCDSRITELNDLLSSITTFEVKEVDLDAELEHYKAEQNIKYEEDINMFEFAKHFFELGLRSTITEEDMKLIWTIGDELPYMAEEEFYKELLKRFKAQKGE